MNIAIGSDHPLTFTGSVSFPGKAQLKQLRLPLKGVPEPMCSPPVAGMTVESAAETLMVSPGFLVGLLERGAIPFDRTRTGYSLQASDIEDFQAVLRKRQDAFLAELDAEIED